jgi:spore maturation protein CgeB
MLSQYTKDLAALFAPDQEALFFRNSGELVNLAKQYLADDTAREHIARAGKKRLLHDGHEVTDRAREILKVYTTLCTK